jgi:hypothetical protein
MKRIVWLFIDFFFVNSNGLLMTKIWISHMIRISQNEKEYIDSHSKFAIKTQYIM